MCLVRNLLVVVLSFVGLCSCIQTSTLQHQLAPEQYRLPVIPEKYHDSPVVLLEHQTELNFEYAETGNTVRRKDVRWFHVNNKNSDGIEDVSIHWSRTFESPISITAKVFYPDGTMWKLPQEKIDSDEDPFSNSVNESFLIPGYQSGVVIQLIVEREYLQPEFYGRFVLSNSYPTLNRTITLTYPDDIELKNGLVNGQDIDITTSTSQKKGEKNVRIEATDLEKFKKTYMTPYPEKYYAAFYASFPPKGKKSYSWEELGDHYLELSKEAFEITPAVEELAQTVTAKTDQEIIRASFDKVVRKIRYHGEWKGKFAFYPRKAEVVLKNGYGDCKELTTILKTLLQTKGVKSHFVLLATWNVFGPVEEYPTLGTFNHAILTVKDGDGNFHFLDATHSWATADNSYYASVGRKAFVLDEGKSRLVDIVADPGFANRVETDSQLIKNARNGAWSIDGKIHLIGGSALKYYESLKYSTSYDNEYFTKRYLKRKFNIDATHVDIQSVTPDEVFIGYRASFQENYLALGEGGFKLVVPSLYRSVVNDNYKDLAGVGFRANFEQIDRWQLPFSPRSVEAESFASALAAGGWQKKGGLMIRNYKQSTMKFTSQDKALQKWYEDTRNFVNSRVWK